MVRNKKINGVYLAIILAACTACSYGKNLSGEPRNDTSNAPLRLAGNGAGAGAGTGGIAITASYLNNLANTSAGKNVIPSIPPKSIGQLSAEDVGKLYTAVYASMSSEQVQAIDGGKLSGQTFRAIANLSQAASILEKFSPQQLANMEPGEKQKIPPNMLKLLSREQSAALLTGEAPQSATTPKDIRTLTP